MKSVLLFIQGDFEKIGTHPVLSRF